VDLPADLIKATSSSLSDAESIQPVSDPPRGAADASRLARIVSLLQAARVPLVVIGKGAAYARAEEAIRALIDDAHLPFLPTPMGKGVVADSHPFNAASARSAALREADVVLLLGARLNWILHFGEAPKWNANVRFIQVDNDTSEIGKNKGDAELGIVGDITVVVDQLHAALSGWRWDAAKSSFWAGVSAARDKNERAAAAKAEEKKSPLSYHQAFGVIKRVLNELSPVDDGGVVYVSEGANTMDISRSIFPVSHPRLRLDAGTHATMGVGLGYAIAAYAAYNFESPEGHSGKEGRKKIVAIEGDSAFGFSGMEIETMARWDMDVLIVVMNNGGVYHGDADSEEIWEGMKRGTVDGKGKGLRSTSLGWEVGYEQMAEMCGGKGWKVRTEEELERATREGYEARVPVVLNVIIEPGAGKKLVCCLRWHD
jgi:2-hydroxyacyl-CoA lyase 1